MPAALTQPERIAATPTWWRSPQRVWLRRALFQVHLWVGIVLASYSIVIGVSGAALVFRGQIEARQQRSFHLSTEPSTLTLTEVLRKIEFDRPGWHVTGLKLQDRRDVPLSAMMGRKGSGREGDYRSILFDPRTGQVFQDRMRYDGLLGWLAQLHFNLLAGRKGLLVSGWMSVGILILCLSGIVLWWPGVARSAGALILRLHRNQHRRTLNCKRLNWDLHSVIGFWSCATLTVVTVTGLYFAFPKPLRNFAVVVTGGSIHQADLEEDVRPRKAAAGTAPLLTIDQALAAARRELPADAPPGYVAIPMRPGAPWYVTGYYRNALPFSKLVSITLDPRTGELLSSSDTTKHMLGLRALQYVFTIHFGSFGGDGILGLIVRVLWVFLGLAPAALAITGLLMFWNRKIRPRLAHRRT